MLLIQTEILASLQSIDQKIEQQQERKQRLLGELEAQEEQIRAKKQEIEVLVAGFADLINGMASVRPAVINRRAQNQEGGH